MHEEDTPLIYSHDEKAFQQLRTRNSAVIFDALGGLGKLEGTAMLDIGCSYGWFMEEAKKKGIIPYGVDPQPEKAGRAIDKGLDVKIGYFPADVEPSRKYDIISLNDVLEHLEDADGAIKNSGEFLNSEGRLVICFPDSHGFYYRLSVIFNRMGWKTPLDRLWQKGYPSPHIYYFNSGSLEKLVSRHGFRLAVDKELKASTIKGLWERIHVDKKRPSLSSIIIYISVLVVIVTLERLFRSDSRMHIYRKLPGQPGEGSLPGASA